GAPGGPGAGGAGTERARRYPGGPALRRPAAPAGDRVRAAHAYLATAAGRADLRPGPGAGVRRDAAPAATRGRGAAGAGHYPRHRPPDPVRRGGGAGQRGQPRLRRATGRARQPVRYRPVAGDLHPARGGTTGPDAAGPPPATDPGGAAAAPRGRSDRAAVRSALPPAPAAHL